LSRVCDFITIMGDNLLQCDFPFTFAPGICKERLFVFLDF